MLASLAGETALISGHVYMPQSEKPTLAEASRAIPRQDWVTPGAKAFVAQSPWLENASIRDNILYGLPMDLERYREVIWAVSLRDDLRALEDSDRTEVGALGINLSGGQRLRLTLARALYSRAAILILDDVFSAVDAHVGRHILNEALQGPLCKDRTVIIATHHHELVAPVASYVVRVESGTANGTIKDVSIVYRSDAKIAFPDLKDRDLAMFGEDEIENRAAKKFVEEETRQMGSISSAVYHRYIRASGGYTWWALILACFIVAAGINFSRKYAVKLWTQMADVSDKQSSGEPPDFFYLGIFVALSLASTVLSMVQLGLVYIAALKAARALFEDMTSSILHAPLRWIERVPTGRILNRFVGDIEKVDGYLADDIFIIMLCSFNIITVVATVGLVSFWMLIPAALLIAAALAVTFLYLPGAREVKRLDSTAESPIVDTLTSVLAGLATIRSFKREEAYTEKMDKLIDHHGSTLFSLNLTSSWVEMRQGLLVNVFLGVAVVFAFATGANASLTGFVLSSALGFSDIVSSWIWRYSALELNMNALE